jgi:hypothetical protein
MVRFHNACSVCGRLVTHPLHENLHPGDTLLRNPHRPSKSAGPETLVLVDWTTLIIEGVGNSYSLTVGYQQNLLKALINISI